MRAIGIAIPFFRRRSGVPIDAQAQAHFNRVIADGGVVPSGLSGVNSFFTAIKAIYGTSDINTAISAAYDAQYLGYKLGAGSGTTLGQAAQKLYSVKSTENLLLQSEDFASVSWSRENVSNSGNVTTAPNGTLTADSIIDDNFNSRHINFQTFNGVLSDSRTFSIYAKQNTLRYLFLSVTNSGDSHCYSAIFDLQLGVVSATKVNGNGTISASIESAANGWYRCIISGTMTTGSAVFYPLIGTSDRPAFTGSLTSNNAPSYIGSNQSLFIWGAQLNTGSLALPYTPTTTTAQTLADVTQTTAASQPLLLAHTGENYWFGSGVTNNFVSTPNAAANQITGDIEIVAKISIYDTSFYNVIIAKDDTVNRSYALSVSNSGFAVMTLKIGSAAAADFTSSISCGFSANTINWLKATRKESDGSINFYKSTDGITYTKIGTTISSTSGLLNNSSAVVSVNSQGVNNCSKIKIYQATIANTISPTPLTSNSTPVVDFNPASYNPSVSQTQWTSATGEVWSLNVGTATSGYKGVLVDRTIVQGDGVDDTFGGISINIQTVYNARRLFTNSGSGAIAHLYTNSTRYLERRVNGFSIFNGTYLNSLLANNINLNYIMGQYNSSNSIISVNNSADIVGNSGSTAPSGTFNVFNVGNHTLNTFVCTNALDAALQRTAMYNYIRSINGNSF